MKSEIKSEIKAGSTVILNSGGPRMTVIDLDKDMVTCCWFEGNKKLEDSFNIKTITSCDSSVFTPSLI